MLCWYLELALKEFVDISALVKFVCANLYEDGTLAHLNISIGADALLIIVFYLLC